MVDQTRDGADGDTHTEFESHLTSEAVDYAIEQTQKTSLSLLNEPSSLGRLKARVTHGIAKSPPGANRLNAHEKNTLEKSYRLI